jgi:streptogramin lyase
MSIPRRAAMSLGRLAVGLALALLPVATASARPEGLIHELTRPSNVGQIEVGPGGEVWFTGFAAHHRPASIGWMTPGGKIHRFPLPKGVEPNELTIGSDGVGWFTYSRGGLVKLGTAGGGIGRIDRGGKVKLFPEPPNTAGSPFDLVQGSDGNLWFDHLGAFAATGGAIGRITPSGQITEFSAGLLPSAEVTHLTAGEDGNVWFADNSKQPAIGRITPAGVITEFPGLPPQQFGFVQGPAPAGPDGLYFAVTEKPPPAVERISSSGAISRFTAGLSPRAGTLGSFLGSPTGDAWFAVGRIPPEIGHASIETVIASGAGTPAIAHISAAGQITEFSRCLRPQLGIYGVGGLVHGPDGNVWFSTGAANPNQELGEPAATPAIGRITPAGKITEFRYGLQPESDPEDLDVGDGRIWFLDSRLDRIGWIVPPKRPANTVLALSLLHGFGSRPVLEVAVPGPGVLRLREEGRRRGLASSTAAAPACGRATIPVPMRPPLVQALHRKGVVFLSTTLTFTPRGGTPFGTPFGTAVKVEVGGKRN